MQRDTPKVIAALELLAAVQAVSICEGALDGIRTFVFVDNEAAQANLISMSSPVPVQSELLRELFHAIPRRSMYLWDISNLADGPSRLVVESLLHQGFTQVSPSWQLVTKMSVHV